MNGNHTLLNLIWDWSNIVDKARDVKKGDPERRQKTVRFGIVAIVYALLTVACSCGLLLFKFVGDGLFITIICLLFGVGIGVFGTLVCVITALIEWFCQLSINKKPITWVSLALMLVFFAAAAVVPLIFLVG